MLRLANILLALAATISIAGCTDGQPPQVPEHAKLLHYGQGTWSLPQRPVPGQYWLYDESAGRVVSVVTIPSTNDAVSLKFDNLDTRHWYRLYLVDQQPQDNP